MQVLFDCRSDLSNLSSLRVTMHNETGALGQPHSHVNSSGESSLLFDPWYTAVEIIVAVLSVIGNLLVIVVFIRYQVLRTITNYYVISLAVADLLVGLVGIPSALFTAVGLPQNFHACLFMTSVLMLLCTGSIFSLVGVTIDRFWAIFYPLTYHGGMTHQRALITITVCWLTASLIGVLPSMGWNSGEPDAPQCLFLEVMDLRYLFFIFVATILIPSMFMAGVYFLIYRAVRRQVRRMSIQMVPRDSVVDLPITRKSNARQERNGRQLSIRNIRHHVTGGGLQPLTAETRAAKSLAVIVMLFVVSWIPLYLLNTVMYFLPDLYVPERFIKFLIVLSHFNSCWNPALYAWGMRDFRHCLHKMLNQFHKPRTLIAML